MQHLQHLKHLQHVLLDGLTALCYHPNHIVRHDKG
jgi:hypothetical protein